MLIDGISLVVSIYALVCLKYSTFSFTNVLIYPKEA